MSRLDPWLYLEEEIGYKNARIVAYAISYLGRTDTWRFLPWFSKLKEDDRKLVEEYFDDFLLLEMWEMSKNENSDISHIIDYFNLPKLIRISKVYTNYKQQGLTILEFLKTKEGKEWAKSKRMYKYLMNKYKSNN